MICIYSPANVPAWELHTVGLRLCRTGPAQRLKRARYMDIDDLLCSRTLPLCRVQRSHHCIAGEKHKTKKHTGKRMYVIEAYVFFS